MIKKTYVDSEGYKHLTLCHEDDEPEEGVHQDPPVLGNLDWYEIEKELHNRLVETGLITWRDVQGGVPLVSIITSIMKPKIVRLYKLSEKGEL